jgi:hypothetical protein
VIGASAAVGAVLATAAAAWACIAGPTLNVNPAQVKPGQQVALSGFSYNGDLPIVVRFNGLDGPVLGTFTPAEGRFGDPELLSGTVTIPADTKPGTYVLIATQSNSDGTLAQVPVRAVVAVTSPGGGPIVGAPLAPVDAGRPVGPALNHSGPSTGALLLVGVGTAGVVMFLAGVASLAAGRRRTTEPVPAPTRR